DYPLRSPSTIRNALAEAEGRSFMLYHRLPFEGWGPRGGFDRVEDWHLVSRVALHVRLPRKRRVPGGLEPYGGGRPWILRREAVRYVDDYVRSNPGLVRFFEHVLHPSELMFQTVLLNSPFAREIVNDHRHYLEWRGGSSPATLTSADLDTLLASDCLFARKFDVTVDSTVLDRIDERMEAQGGVPVR
ncbi:MAG: beta-1,6-N-acetylglucosaminyltransferase, partial [Gaiellaceae bacterium]